MNKITIGIDIGGTNTDIGAVDQNGVVLSKKTLRTAKHGDIEKFVLEIAGVVKEIIKSLEKDKIGLSIGGIGIGAPNGNYYNETIDNAPNLSFKGKVRIVDILRTHFTDIPNIVLTNDANAAALGEMIYGGATNMKNFAVFTLGTGVGSGIVVNGELVYGHDGFAGECGHTTIVPNGRLCNCGAFGHLEAYCSASGMVRTAFELFVKYNPKESFLTGRAFDEVSSKMIYEAAIQGDSIAKEVFEITGYYLGIGLANAVQHLSPEAIFLFGGPVAAGSLIFDPTRKSMENHLLPIFKNKIKLLPSQLKDGDVAIIGASALARNEAAKGAVGLPVN